MKQKMSQMQRCQLLPGFSFSVLWVALHQWGSLNPCNSFSPAEMEEVFANKEKVQKEVKATLTKSATLSCEVTQAKTEVKWYKDGKLITSNKKFKVESEGKSRHLVVGQVEKKDAGEYTCEAAGQKLIFKIVVTGKKQYCLSTLGDAEDLVY
uniref:Ig-like domain-containing protein n=1 Tax=Chelonoidis abingdonii TaxID=106734 RepID=A0A8C0H9W5_CHEAB